jgi:hypothetical protein
VITSVKQRINLANAVWVVGVVTVGLGSGATMIYYPTVLLLLIVTLATIIAVSTPHGTVFWFGVGILLTYQTSTAISTSKVAFLLIAILLAGRALGRILRRIQRNPVASDGYRAVLRGFALLITALIFAILVGVSRNNTVANVIRDLSTYTLLAVSIPIGLDATGSASERTQGRIMWVVGLLASIGFTVNWLTRRGVGTFGLTNLVLATTTLLALIVSYSVVRGLGDRIRRVSWLLLAAIGVSSVVLTGTRSGLILVVAALGTALAGKSARVRGGRVVLFLAVGTSIGAYLLPLVGNEISTDGFFVSRFAKLGDLFNGGLASDQSAIARSAAYGISNAAWRQHPWLGQGFGRPYAGGTLNPQGTLVFGLDSPIIILAKFGLVGALLIGAAFSVALRGLKLLPNYDQRSLPVVAGFVTYAVASLPFGVILEDKGASLVIALLLLTASRQRRSEAGVEDDNGLSTMEAHRR